jgi:NAD(P)-dependent dehydrogenase (short-subunit alcohol dehydrogenase family)
MIKPSAIVIGVGAECGLGAALCRRFALGGYYVLVAGRAELLLEPLDMLADHRRRHAELTPRRRKVRGVNDFGEHC